MASAFDASRSLVLHRVSVEVGLDCQLDRVYNHLRQTSGHVFEKMS